MFKYPFGTAALLAVTFACSMPAAEPARQPTFTRDIAPIFQEKCQECHRTGSMAPMSLLTYEEARPWAKAIKQKVVTRAMPPWHMDKTVGIQKFANDSSLSEEQVATISRWVDAGAPMGDPKDMPPPKQFPDFKDWQLAKTLGQPDLVIDSEPYKVPAHGQDIWWKPYANIPITEPRWVRAVEIRPTTAGARRVVHHSIARLQQEEPDLRASLLTAADANNSGPGMLMEWAIGKSYDQYEPGTGKLLLPGSRIWWELHLHSVGEEISAQTQLAIYFYPKGQEPKDRTYLLAFSAGSYVGGEHEQTLDIPPNSITQTQGYHVLRHPAKLSNFQPHMHLRGKAMAMEAILPDGSTQMLSYVDKFNFNWMTNYIYAEDAVPVLPAGTVIHITAWHDNTVNNLSNPDPNQWVGWGERTVDEMAHAWVNVTFLSDDEYQTYVAKKGASVAQAGK